MKIEETEEEGRARIMRRINAAQAWTMEAEELLLYCQLDPAEQGRRRRGLIDALLGFAGVGLTKTDKAERNLEEARAELAAACAEWDQFTTDSRWSKADAKH